jgi:Ca-activated chloride channel homolog
MRVPTCDYTPGSATHAGAAAGGSVECNSVRALAAALAVCVACASALPLAARAPQQAPGFRASVDLVNLGVTVSDRKGRLVTGLTADDFEVVEDGKKQALSYFAAGDVTGPPAPEMHLGLLLDVSESMGEDIGFTRTAAIKFLNTLTDAVDITVVDFDTEVRAAVYEQREFARVIERIRAQKVSGDTALYDAIGVYVDGTSGQPGRKIMLLYTDGGDTRSSMRFGELLDLLKASDVTIYVIGELEHQTQSGKLVARQLLQQIADATGGQAFFPLSVKTLDVVYDQVLAEIRAQYTLGYVSTNPAADGAWRKVDVKVTRQDGRADRVRSRKGYYALYKKPAN